MPELPSFNRQQKPTFDLTLAEVTSAYLVLRNHVRVNESTNYTPGSQAAMQYLEVKSAVRKLEAALDSLADHQLRTDAKASEDR